MTEPLPFSVVRADSDQLTITGRVRRSLGGDLDDAHEAPFELTMTYRDEALLLVDALWHHGHDLRQAVRLGTLHRGSAVYPRPAIMTRLFTSWSEDRPSSVTPVVNLLGWAPGAHLVLQVAMTLSEAATLHDLLEEHARHMPADPKYVF